MTKYPAYALNLQPDRIYWCELRSASGTSFTAALKKVDEEDCEWRTVDDDSELSYEWDVVRVIREVKKISS